MGSALQQVSRAPRLYIQLFGETICEALSGDAFDSEEDILLEAHRQLPAGAKFKILDGDFRTVLYEGEVSDETYRLIS